MKSLSISCLSVAFVMGLLFAACSTDTPDEPQPITPSQPATPEEPSEPDTPEPSNDTIEVGFTYLLDVKVEDLYPSSRDEASMSGNDLIGVSIYKGDYFAIGQDNYRYASAVFDDVTQMKVKLVKGQTYTFTLQYVPDAKEFVYHYPDGSFGKPFRNTCWDDHNQWLPNVVYYNDGYYTGGYQAVLLYGLGRPFYQTGPNEDTGVMEYINRPHYWGEITVIIDEDNKVIEIPLTLCQIGITINADNFTEGKIRMRYGGGDRVTYDFEPDGDNKLVLATSAPTEYSQIRFFYVSPDDKVILIGSSNLRYEFGKNYVYSFDLNNLDDGAIAMVLPEDEPMEDVDMALE